MIKKNSPECWNNSECKHCGCSLPAKAFENRGCELGCYPDMMGEDKWNEFWTQQKIVTINPGNLK